MSWTPCNELASPPCCAGCFMRFGRRKIRAPTLWSGFAVAVLWPSTLLTAGDVLKRAVQQRAYLPLPALSLLSAALERTGWCRRPGQVGWLNWAAAARLTHPVSA